MVASFPQSRPFLPQSLRWRLVDAQEEGPAPYGLPAAVIGVDGGGWWTARFGDMQAGEPGHHRALRALALALRGGRRVNVPFVDKAPIGWPDATLMATPCVATLAADVALRDDEAQIQVTSGHALEPGLVFSIDRADDLGHAMFALERAEDLGDGLWGVRIGPQFRQAFDAGAACEFSAPKCAMRLVDPEGDMWPQVERAYIGRATAFLREAF